MKQHVVRHQLKSGDRLPTEHEWVEMLGVSRLVVREALQMLAGSGLIDVQQGRGAFIREASAVSAFDQLTFGIDLDQLDYVYVFEARAMLDLAVVELCMQRADDAALAEAEALLEQMRLAEGERRPVENLHRPFHYRLLRAAGNPLIERVGLALMDTFWRISDGVPDLMPLGLTAGYSYYETHRALLDTIKSRDLRQARQAVFNHLPQVAGMQPGFPHLAD